MPGIGPRSAAQILMTVDGMSDFPDAAHLASYAGLSPQTDQSGTSIMSNTPNRTGNKKLKNALWQSSFASIRFHERSRQFYERKRNEGKRHNAAVARSHADASTSFRHDAQRRALQRHPHSPKGRSGLAPTAPKPIAQEAQSALQHARQQHPQHEAKPFTPPATPPTELTTYKEPQEMVH